MNSKPIIVEKLELVHTAYKIEFIFQNNITLLMGNSGSGKTTAFNIIQEASFEEQILLCIN